MKDQLKLQLSTKALAKLLEDKEIRLELTGRVLQSFSQEYIKPLLNHDAFKHELDKIITENNTLKEGFKNEVGKFVISNFDQWKKQGYYSRITPILTAEASKLIKDILEDYVNNSFKEEIERLATAYVKSYEGRLSEIVRAEVTRQESKMIKEMVADAVNEKKKEVLKLLNES